MSDRISHDEANDYIEQQRAKDFGERIAALEKEIAELRERRGGGG